MGGMLPILTVPEARVQLRIAHNPADGKNSCRVIVMRDGKVAASTWLYTSLLNESSHRAALFRAVDHVLRVAGCTERDL